MAEVVENLPVKHKALSSNHSTAKKKRKEGRASSWVLVVSFSGTVCEVLGSISSIHVCKIAALTGL
jgi:hypothetical protein